MEVRDQRWKAKLSERRACAVETMTREGALLRPEGAVSLSPGRIALGTRAVKTTSPEGAHSDVWRAPLRGLFRVVSNPGRWPGLRKHAPSGLNRKRRFRRGITAHRCGLLLLALPAPRTPSPSRRSSRTTGCAR